MLNDVLSVGGGKYLVACYMLHARETLDIYSSDGTFVHVRTFHQTHVINFKANLVTLLPEFWGTKPW